MVLSESKRQSQHKTTGQSLWHVPLSARSEFHSHPLAEQAQACGRLTEAEGPEGQMAPIVTTGGYSVEKTFSHVILALGAMHICSVLFNGEEPRIVRVILVPGPCLSSPYHKKKNSNHASRPCAGGHAYLLCIVQREKNLEFCASSLCKNHGNRRCIPSVEDKLDYTGGLLRDIRTFGRVVEGSNVSPSRTQWVASQAEGAVVTQQEQLQLLHSSVPGPIPSS